MTVHAKCAIRLRIEKPRLFVAKTTVVVILKQFDASTVHLRVYIADFLRSWVLPLLVDVFVTYHHRGWPISSETHQYDLH